MSENLPNQCYDDVLYSEEKKASTVAVVIHIQTTLSKSIVGYGSSADAKKYQRETSWVEEIF